MSVSDPLVKDLKGCVQQFLKLTSTSQKITDNNFYFILLCQTIEKIFNKGLIRQQNTKYFNRIIDSFALMVGVAKSGKEDIGFPYVDSVEKVRERKDVQTNEGRFRLLVKFCLAKKCLQVPVQFLKKSGNATLFYSEYSSIIGDEILSEIFLSVLLQLTKINFTLDLENSCFLDNSWYIPELIKMELVPSKSLGVSVSFSDNRAVVVNVASNSVAAESGIIKVGDVLETLNGIHISSALKGKLGSIMKRHKNQPINLTIAKAFNKETKEIYSPIEKLLKDLKIDLDTVKNQNDEGCGEDIAKKSGSGYEVDYVGTVDMGEIGSVRQVQRALKCMLCQSENNATFLVTHIGKKVIFEIGEIGVKVKDAETRDIILEHSYMRISSCGNLLNVPCIFGYSAGNENCDIAEKFVCHVFEVKKFDDADIILQSLGQGFQRTHYAV